jgi:hypothetical protein
MSAEGNGEKVKVLQEQRPRVLKDGTFRARAHYSNDMRFPATIEPVLRPYCL